MTWEKLKVLGLLVLLPTLMTGCVPRLSFDGVLQAKGEGKGTVEVYPVPADQAWEIAKTVFLEAGLETIHEYRGEGYMLSSSTGTSRWLPTLMGAWIEPLDESRTKVTVVRRPLNILTRLREGTYHERFSQAVQIIKAGKPLPLESPE